MNLFDFTYPTPAENLACDEVLLDASEAADGPELLRFWEPATTFVVLGYGNKLEGEVNVPACEAAAVPIMRRCSGGGTVLQAEGCLNYSVILRIVPGGPLQSIPSANRYIMDRQRAALDQLLAETEASKALAGVPQAGGSNSPAVAAPMVSVRGHTDLPTPQTPLSAVPRHAPAGDGPGIDREVPADAISDANLPAEPAAR